MPWYVQYRRFDGSHGSAIHADYPQDRSADGSQRKFLVRKEIPAEHAEKSLDELDLLYGEPAVIFRSCRTKS